MIAGNTAPPMIAITMSDDPRLVSGPRFLMPSAKIVGNMMEWKNPINTTAQTGTIPFARTKAERMANEDPRLSLEERYANHAGYVAAVEAAARNAVAAGFLLEADRKALVAAAEASDVLK